METQDKSPELAAAFQKDKEVDTVDRYLIERLKVSQITKKMLCDSYTKLKQQLRTQSSSLSKVSAIETKQSEIRFSSLPNDVVLE